MAREPLLSPIPQPAQCLNCLGLGHTKKECNQQIRCKACFNYGHISSGCLSKKRDQWCYRVVSRSEVESSCPSDINAEIAPLLEPSVPPTSPPTTTVHQENPPSEMANYAMDPCPFVPAGFELEDPSLRPQFRQEVYVASCYSHVNEDLAIIKLNSLVDKADFELTMEGSAPSSMTGIRFAPLRSSHVQSAKCMSDFSVP